MACAVAGPLWEQEMGARQLIDASSAVPTTLLPVKQKSSALKDSTSTEKRKRKRSPFRPWTPELLQQQQLDQLPSSPQSQHPPPTSTILREDENSRDTTSSIDDSLPTPQQMSLPPASVSSSSQRRNYKNMTRERRIEANARERTRVHTISAAFENLRRAVPAYSHNQKLSKLAVLRVAASYILTLSRLIDEDYSLDNSEPTLESCIESITSTIQMEGRLKKKKED